MSHNVALLSGLRCAQLPLGWEPRGLLPMGTPGDYTEIARSDSLWHRVRYKHDRLFPSSRISLCSTHLGRWCLEGSPIRVGQLGHNGDH